MQDQLQRSRDEERSGDGVDSLEPAPQSVVDPAALRRGVERELAAEARAAQRQAFLKEHGLTITPEAPSAVTSGSSGETVQRREAPRASTPSVTPAVSVEQKPAAIVAESQATVASPRGREALPVSSVAIQSHTLPTVRDDPERTLLALNHFPGFETIAVIGHGSIAEVAHVRQARLGAEGALKVVSPIAESVPEAERLLASEARLSNELAQRCPEHFLTVIDASPPADHLLSVDSDRARVAFLYDLAPESFAEKFGTPLPIDEALDYFKQLCDAVNVMHTHPNAEGTIGIPHGDLKPTSIRIGDDRLVKIVDLNSCSLKIKPNPHSIVHSMSMMAGPAARQIAGTIEYMAPEQRRFEPATVRTDTYQLAQLLYMMVSGEEAPAGFPAPLEGPLAGLNQVFHRAMARDASRRYESVDALRAAVLDAIGQDGRTTDATKIESVTTPGQRTDLVFRPSYRTTEPSDADCAVLAFASWLGSDYDAWMSRQDARGFITRALASVFDPAPMEVSRPLLQDSLHESPTAVNSAIAAGFLRVHKSSGADILKLTEKGTERISELLRDTVLQRLAGKFEAKVVAGVTIHQAGWVDGAVVVKQPTAYLERLAIAATRSLIDDGRIRVMEGVHPWYRLADYANDGLLTALSRMSEGETLTSGDQALERAMSHITKLVDAGVVRRAVKGSRYAPWHEYSLTRR